MPIEAFISYSHRDRALRDQLSAHLALLKRQRIVTEWHDRQIGAGDDWKSAIDAHLERAGIILLLISADFLASDYCFDVEMKRALERHDSGDTQAIPVIVRACDWTSSPFGRLQALPTDAKPVTSWGRRDEAWADVVRGIRAAVRRIECKDTIGPLRSLGGSQPEAPEFDSATAAALATLRARVHSMTPGEPLNLDADTLVRVQAMSPTNQQEYVLARIAHWAGRLYQVDKRFTPLTVLIDRGEEEGDRWLPVARRDDLRRVLRDISDAAIFVVLGGPGTGKSTLLRRLELDVAIEAATQSTPVAPWTVFVNLNGYRNLPGMDFPPRPQDWIAEQWQTNYPRLAPLFPSIEKPRTLMAEAPVLLLLDGLNEIENHGAADYARRLTAWREFIHDFVQKRDGNRVVLTCRSLNYSEGMSAAGFRVPHVRIDELSDSQVEEFLKTYLSVDDSALLWDQLRPQSGRVSPPIDLFRTPYYLHMLIRLVTAPHAAAGTRDQRPTIPSGRTGLFTNFIRECLEREAVDKHNPLLSALQLGLGFKRLVARTYRGPFDLAGLSLIDRLATLAYQMQDGSRRVEGEGSLVRIERRRAEEILGEDAAWVIATGVDLQVLEDLEIDDGVQFVHQLLQQYFAARALATRATDAAAIMSLAHFAAEPWKASELPPVVFQNEGDQLPPARQSVWHETFTLAAPMLARPAELIRALMGANLPLAGECAAQSELVVLPLELRTELQWALMQRSRDPEADLRARIAAAHALGKLGDPRYQQRSSPYGDHLLPPLIEVSADIYIAGSNEQDGDGRPEPLATLLSFQIGQYPVTNAEWEFFERAGGGEDPRWWASDAARQESMSIRRKSEHAGLLEPALVTLHAADAYCRWLSAASGLAYTIPTVEQWEASARGTGGREFPWGNSFDASNANTWEAHIRAASPVGVFPGGDTPAPDKGKNGISDLAGNAWEWCATRYSRSGGAPTGGNSPDPGAERLWVTKGGSWKVRQQTSRTSFRGYGLNGSENAFRLLRVPCDSGMSSSISSDLKTEEVTKEVSAAFMRNNRGEVCIAFQDPVWVRANRVLVDGERGSLHAVLNGTRHLLGHVTSSMLRAFSDNQEVLLTALAHDGTTVEDVAPIGSWADEL